MALRVDFTEVSRSEYCGTIRRDARYVAFLPLTLRSRDGLGLLFHGGA